MELVSLRNLSRESKIALLQELGYSSDGNWVLSVDGEKLLDKYTEEPIRLENCLILPGSTIENFENPVATGVIHNSQLA